MEAVWYHPEGVTYVLSQTKAVKENCFEVKYSSRRDKKNPEIWHFVSKLEKSSRLSSYQIRRAYTSLTINIALDSESLVVSLKRSSVYQQLKNIYYFPIAYKLLRLLKITRRILQTKMLVKQRLFVSFSMWLVIWVIKIL